jgi:nucleotide-binding universal stress UspA family protein
MNLGDILVIMDRSPASDVRLELAMAYASRHGARLSGVIYGEPGVVPPPWQDELATLFIEKCEEVDINARWCGHGLAKLNHLAHASDLIVVGQPDERGGNAVPSDLPEWLVLYSGRPVVTVPYSGRFIPRCERILIAWSDGRESTRALHDAMPLLRRAQRVHIVNLVTDKSAINGAEERLEEIVEHLYLSGVRVKGEMVLSIDFPPGDMLLNRACEERSDLLVMGVYNRTGNGKAVLGQVARHILRQMTLPVLMSH